MSVLSEAPPAKLSVPVLRAASLRADVGENEQSSVLEGHFSVFNNWFEINSMFEGHFLERVAPGSFKRTFDHWRSAVEAGTRDTILLMLEHGMDFRVGDRPLGRFQSLHEDATGAAYSARLFDEGYVNELLPAFRAGLYGASYRFQVLRDSWDYNPEPTEDNPEGLPQRTILEQRVLEAGPTVFPANPEATAGLRSVTDRFYESLRSREPAMYDDILRQVTEQRTATASDGTAHADRSAEIDSPHGTRRTPKHAEQLLRKYRFKWGSNENL